MSRNNPYRLNKNRMKRIGYFDQEDTPDALQRRKVEDYNNFNLSDVKIADREYGGETTDRWDLGRNCPFCAGRLVTAEHSTGDGEELHLLQCTSCGKRVYASDIDHQSETVDKLYRTIDDRTFQKWLAYKDERK